MLSMPALRAALPLHTALTGLTALAALTALTATCAAPPPADVRQRGIETPVEILDAAFVQFEGRRCAVEWFLLEMRERARRAEGDAAKLPHVVVEIREGAAGVDSRWNSQLVTELEKAGIRAISFGTGG